MLNSPSKETIQLLADAASRIQLRQRERNSSGSYFTLAACALLMALGRLPGALGIGWLACGTGLIIVALYGLTGAKLEPVLMSRFCVSIAFAAYSLYCASRAQQGFGFLFAALGGVLSLSSALRLRTYRSVNPTTPELLNRVWQAFVTASRSDPRETPGLVSLRRAIGFKSFLPDNNAHYDYRLLYDRDVVFLIGMNSFLGFRYSASFMFITPSRTFHIEVLADSRNGTRNKVRLMLDNEQLLEPLEITPEMLLKAQQYLAQSPA